MRSEAHQRESFPAGRLEMRVPAEPGEVGKQGDTDYFTNQQFWTSARRWAQCPRIFLGENRSKSQRFPSPTGFQVAIFR